MKIMICCEIAAYRQHDFYMIYGQRKYYLFSQKYAKSVQEHFGGKVIFGDIQLGKMNRRNFKIRKTLDKLPKYIKYVEAEYNLTALNSTMRKRRDKQKTPMAS